MTLAQLVEAIAALPLTEARALLEALTARLAVEAPPPDTRFDRREAVAAYGAPPHWRAFDERFEPHVVRLVASGPERTQVMRQLRLALSVSLAEAKAAIDGAPCDLGEFPDREAARAVQSALVAAGATVDVRCATATSALR